MDIFKDILQGIILSSAGIGLIFLILGRILPNKKLYKLGISNGKFLTNQGRSKLGKTLWEKIEDFLENSMSVYLRGLRDGANYDNNKKN